MKKQEPTAIFVDSADTRLNPAFSGEIIWADRWTPEQIEAGRRDEEARRGAYDDALDRKSRGKMQHFWRWAKSYLSGRGLVGGLV